MTFCYFLFLSGLFYFICFSVHYIHSLLLLELLLFAGFLLMSLFFCGSCGLVGSFFFLLMMVCMGGFSISLLVALSRVYGRDFWCFSFVF